jgi:hypothetical protein
LGRIFARFSSNNDVESLVRRPEDFRVRHRFGVRERFAVEVGAVVSGDPTTGLREVNLWAAGQELCCDDNAAFVPQFCLSVEATITWLLSESDRSLPYPELSPEENHRRLWAAEYGDRSQYTFMDWGPTTDNMFALLFRRGPDAILTVEFCRPTHVRPDELGQVFVSELPEREVLRVLHQAVCILRSGK